VREIEQAKDFDAFVLIGDQPLFKNAPQRRRRFQGVLGYLGQQADRSFAELFAQGAVNPERDVGHAFLRAP
jgi:hypothetical protein